MNITPDKKVGIFTTFGNWDDAYSPCNVVKNQLLALLRHGYSPTLFVLDVFPESSANALISIFDQYKEKVEMGSLTINAASKLFTVTIDAGDANGLPLMYIRVRIETAISGGNIEGLS